MPVDLSNLDADGLPVGLLQRVGLVESGNNAAAVSPKGARGQFQLMPATAKGMGVDPDDPSQNRAGAISYLKQMYQRTGSWPLALAAYNEGPGRLERQGVLPSTAGYVQKVLGMSDTPTASLLNPSVLHQLGIMPNPADMTAVRTAAQGADQARGAVRQQTDAMAPDYERIQAGLSEPGPVLPHAPAAPPPPGDKYGDPKQALGKFLPMMAILGGALSRRYSLAAIKAATGAMEGAHQGDEDRIKLHHDQWMDAMSKLKTDWEQTKDEYEAAREKHGDNKADLLAQLQVLGARTDNLLLKTSLANGDLDTAVKVISAQGTAMEPLMHVYDQALQQDRMREEMSLRERELAEKQKTDDWRAHHGDETANPVNKAYNDAKADGKSDKEAGDAARAASLATHPGQQGSVARAEHGEFLKDQRVKSFSAARPYFDSIDQADINSAPGQIQLLDAFTRIANGGQAIRQFMVRGAQDAMSLQDKATAELQRLKAGHGTIMDARVAQEYRDAAHLIQGELQKNYDAASTTYEGQAKRGGVDPADVILDDDEVARLGKGDAAPAGGKYKVGQIIDHGGKRYRVTGGDMNDPDVEPVK